MPIHKDTPHRPAHYRKAAFTGGLQFFGSLLTICLPFCASIRRMRSRWPHPLPIAKAGELSRDLLTWWYAEVAALFTFPQQLLSDFGSRSAVLVLHPRGVQLLLPGSPDPGPKSRSSSCELQPISDIPVLLSGIDSRKMPVLLRIDPDYVLSTCLRLPLNSAPHIGKILSFEIERLTPFHPSEIFYTYRAATDNSTRPHIAVHLDIVPRRPLTDALQAIRSSNARVKGVELNTASGAIALRGHDVSALMPPTQPAGHRYLPLAAGLTLLLGFAFVTHPILRATRLEPLVAAAQTEASQAMDSITHANTLLDDLSLIRHQKDSTSVTHMLAALTTVLDDSTYITSLERNESTIVIEGVSSDTAGVLSSLESSSLLQDARFVSPIRRIDGTSTERFALRATLRAGR